MPAATVTSKGQITIPAEVRRSLGLHTGSRVAFVETVSGRYEIRPESGSIRSLEGLVPHKGAAVSLEEMDEAISGGAVGRLRR